jgi:hypothetical protein
MVMAMNSEYRGSASGSMAGKKKTASKTIVTPGTKVSQATIDKIKKMGMSAALKGASSASAEMQEGLRRMYGANRVKAAMGSSKSSVSAQKSTPEKGTGFKRVSPYPYSGVKVKSSTRPSGAPAAVSGKKVSTGTSNKPASVKRPVSSASAKAAESRAGGGYKYNPSQKVGTKPVKSAADKAKEAAATAARRKAAAAAVKRAGGRTA